LYLFSRYLPQSVIFLSPNLNSRKSCHSLKKGRAYGRAQSA
jgi:hypothetical protein